MDSDLVLTLSAIFLVFCAIAAGHRAQRNADRRKARQTWIDSGAAYRAALKRKRW